MGEHTRERTQHSTAQLLATQRSGREHPTSDIAREVRAYVCMDAHNVRQERRYQEQCPVCGLASVHAFVRR